MKNTKKKSAIDIRIERIERSLDRMERGLTPLLPMDSITDYISWLVKFHKVPESVWTPLCERVTAILETEYAMMKARRV